MGKSDTKTTQNTKQLVMLGVIITLIVGVLIFSSPSGSSDAVEPTEAEKLPKVEQIDTDFDLDAIEAVNKRNLFDSTVQDSEGDGNLFDGI